jgi:hypothetical protein
MTTYHSDFVFFFPKHVSQFKEGSFRKKKNQARMDAALPVRIANLYQRSTNPSGKFAARNPVFTQIWLISQLN